MEKINRLIFSFLLAAIVLSAGCATPKPTPDPLVGWHIYDVSHLYSNTAITDDYKSYIQTLSPDEQKFAGPILYYEDGTGQHAVLIMIGINSQVWRHILFYDKNDKRIKTIKYVSGDYHS